jgi:hypothetical protein
MKWLSVMVLLMLALPFASATITIDEQTQIPVIIAGAEDSAPLMLRITNTNAPAEFEIYSLVGVKITPSELTLQQGTHLVEITASPSASIIRSTRGLLLFQYELYNQQSGRILDQKLLKIVDLESIFAIRPTTIKPGDTAADFVLTNVENRTVTDVHLKIDSPFIEHEVTLTMAPYEQKRISVPLKAPELARQVAGHYVADVSFEFGDAEADREWEINYLESSGLSVNETSSGLVIRKHNTIKTNDGSVPITATISYHRDLLSRLFTTLSPDPEQVTKEGLGVTYLWTQELAPAQSLNVVMTTNYTVPFIVLLIVIGAGALAWWIFWKPLVVSKNVHPVRTKGGEFALKVTIAIKAHKNLTNVMLHDHIPHTMQLYQQFGIRPHTIDESARKLSWQLGHLNAGETRVFSYVVYSKMRVVGNFHLPLASATAMADGKPVHVSSNQTAFVSETIARDN